MFKCHLIFRRNERAARRMTKKRTNAKDDKRLSGSKAESNSPVWTAPFTLASPATLPWFALPSSKGSASVSVGTNSSEARRGIWAASSSAFQMFRSTLAGLTPFVDATPMLPSPPGMMVDHSKAPNAKPASQWFFAWDSPREASGQENLNTVNVHRFVELKDATTQSMKSPAAGADLYLLSALAERNHNLRVSRPNLKKKQPKPKQQPKKQPKKQNTRRPQHKTYHKRNVNDCDRECVTCGVTGGAEIHWRRSYDEKRPDTYGADLCDKCGKAESRMLAKRRKNKR